jgi:transcriptional regulator with XRE-family HTH domain
VRWPVQERLAYEFPYWVKARRKELEVTQIELAEQVQIEGRTVSQAHIADLERGHSVPPAEVIEQLARVLKLDRDVLYLAARQLPPDVAEELKRLTPEQRAAAWQAFRRALQEQRTKAVSPKPDKIRRWRTGAKKS